MQKRPVFRKVLENSFWTFFGSGATRFGALIFSILLARFLMPEKFGIYSLAISTAFLFSAFSGLGIETALVRYLSFFLGKRNKAQAKTYMKYLLKIKISLVLLMSFLLLVFAYPISIYVYKKPSLFIPLIFLSIYIILLPLGEFFSAIFTSLKRSEYMAYKESLTQIVRIILILAVFLFLDKSFYLIGTIIVLILTAIFGLGYSIYYSKKMAPYLFDKRIKNGKIKRDEIKSFVRSVMILGLSGIFLSYVDTIMLGIFIPQPEFIAYYRVAYTLAFSISGLFAYTSVLLPFFTQFKKKDLKNTFEKSLRYVSILAIPAFFAILILGNYFIFLIFGRDYLPSMIPLYFLSALIFVESVSGIYGSLLTAREMPQELVKYYISTTLLNIVLNVILITLLVRISSIWAVAGAAIATVLSRTFYLIALFLVTEKNIKLNTSFKFLIPIIGSSIIMAGAIYLLLLKIIDINLVNGVIIVASGLAIYVIGIFVLKGIQKEEIKLIREFLSVMWRRAI